VGDPVTTYRGTVPDRPRRLPSAGYPVDPPFAAAGDVVEVPCGECGGTGWLPDDPACLSDCCSRSGCHVCWHVGECGGRGTVNVRLTEDPKALHKQSKIERVDGAWMGHFDANDPETLVGWLIVGTIECAASS